MYLSSLQKHILKLARINMINEKLNLNSDAFETYIKSYSNKKSNKVLNF